MCRDVTHLSVSSRHSHRLSVSRYGARMAGLASDEQRHRLSSCSKGAPRHSEFTASSSRLAQIASVAERSHGQESFGRCSSAFT